MALLVEENGGGSGAGEPMTPEDAMRRLLEGIVMFREELKATPDEAGRDTLVLNVCTLIDLVLERARQFDGAGQAGVLYALDNALLPEEGESSPTAISLIGWDLLKLLPRFVAVGDEAVRSRARSIMARAAAAAPAAEALIVIAERLELWKWRKDPEGLVLQSLAELLATVVDRLGANPNQEFLHLLIGALRAPLDVLAESIRLTHEDAEEEIAESVARPSNVKAAALAMTLMCSTIATRLCKPRSQDEEEQVSPDRISIAFLLCRVFGAVIANASDITSLNLAPLGDAEAPPSTSLVHAATRQLMSLMRAFGFDIAEILEICARPDTVEDALALDEDAEAPAAEDDETARLGAACYIACSLSQEFKDVSSFPHVMSPASAFESLAPCAVRLLGGGRYASHLGVMLARRAVYGVEAATLDMAGRHDRELAEALISYIVADPDQTRRQDSFALLQHILSLYTESTAFPLLSDLVARCPYSNARSLLVTAVKDRVVKHWNGKQSESWFASPKIVELLETIVTSAVGAKKDTVLENYDVIVATISLALFLVLRDRSDGKTGIRGQYDRLRELLVKPLRTHLSDLQFDLSISMGGLKEGMSFTMAKMPTDKQAFFDKLQMPPAPKGGPEGPPTKEFYLGQQNQMKMLDLQLDRLEEALI